MLTLIKGESKALYVPLIAPDEQPYRAVSYERTPGQLVLKFAQKLPEENLQGLPVKAFLSGALEGCFDVVEANECGNELTLDVSDCYQVDGAGRYIKTCCNGMIHVAPTPIDLTFAIQGSCACNNVPYPGQPLEKDREFVRGDIDIMIKTHVVPEQYRGLPYAAVPISSYTLNTAWVHRDRLPVGSMISIPELGISDATITKHHHVQQRFLHLTIDRAMDTFNCPVDVYHSCDSVIDIAWQAVGECPLAKITLDTTDLVAGAIYHWDLFVSSNGGMCHLHRDSFAVESSY